MFINLRQKSHYSLLMGLPQCDKIVTKAKELGQPAAALTDFNVISGAVDFYNEATNKKDGKTPIKPILGTEICTGHGQTEFNSVLLLAKNLTGWKNIVKTVSRANDEDCFYYRPCVPLDVLGQHSDGVIAIIGGPLSELTRVLFGQKQPITYKDASAILNPDWERDARNVIRKYRDIYGDRLFIETQLTNSIVITSQNLVFELINKIAKEEGVKLVATGGGYYVEQKDNHDHMALLCSYMKTTLPKITRLLGTNQKVDNKEFFITNGNHMPSEVEMLTLYKGHEEQVHNSEYISSLVENFSILSKPQLPHFECPKGMNESEYLKYLCDLGWEKILVGRMKDEEVYKARLKKELGVFDEAKLAGYFLIVQDYVNWARGQGFLIGPGRGSGNGCLTSYLLNITGVDPIPYDLLFERFYNAGRNTKDHVAYPDIDVDFPIEAKEKVIEYIRQKYGRRNVAQLITFGRLLGKSAIKEVLRVHEACDNDTMNDITRFLPDEAKIADKLEDSKETSILRWVLHNFPEHLEKYCHYDDKGNLVGDYAQYFEQAIRLEGTYKSSGKHAAAVVILNDELHDLCPTVRDKNSKEKLVGYEMASLEASGGIKFDVLTVASLSKLQMAQNLLRGKL